MIDRRLEWFSIDSKQFSESDGLRLDASFYNQDFLRVVQLLERSGLDVKSLGELTRRVFMPARFKRTYVSKQYGVPFLQGSHVVHFRPSDVKYLSRTVHGNLESLLIKKGWLLITRSGTVGRATIVPPEWDNWAASEHIFRVVPEESGPCPVGYLCTFLLSPLGQIQLMAHSYGAVVDELTVEHIRGIKIPVARNSNQESEISRINELASQSIALRAKAVELSVEADVRMASLIPGLESEFNGSR